ncbi:DUF6802 family protein [Nocardia camponoti]|uniref:DUF6802 domain-containing protein n=1 Tax=Nocardia camponoti TaxID=1616106 RepID=A0A917VAF7_9NOCA|nr:DUF6802 family protein [Nocardia camponoti]GGK57048.1 hypothetical protein GCM10011591_31460 [Nocardia camponoti]
MVTSGEFSGIGLPHIEAGSNLHDLGPVELAHPTVDISGDGIADSYSHSTPNGTEVWSDYDHDGFADHVTVVEKDGDYAAWEFRRNPDGTSEWHRTDQGKLGS